MSVTAATATIPMMGGQIATRPLHFIWILDCSGSMSVDGKIEALNTAIREALPHMRDVADENPNAQLCVRVITFSSGAQWQVLQPVPVEDFQWTDLEADGLTDLGQALEMVADQLEIANMPQRALPPVLALVSDGLPTDDFNAGLRALMSKPWAQKAVRVAIGIGHDADENCLRKFIGHSELKPLAANNPEMLVKYTKWVSTAVTKAASLPSSIPQDDSGWGLNVPATLSPDDDSTVSTVW